MLDNIQHTYSDAAPFEKLSRGLNNWVVGGNSPLYQRGGSEAVCTTRAMLSPVLLFTSSPHPTELSFPSSFPHTPPSHVAAESREIQGCCSWPCPDSPQNLLMRQQQLPWFLLFCPAVQHLFLHVPAPAAALPMSPVQPLPPTSPGLASPSHS